MEESNNGTARKELRPSKRFSELTEKLDKMRFGARKAALAAGAVFLSFLAGWLAGWWLGQKPGGASPQSQAPALPAPAAQSSIQTAAQRTQKELPGPPPGWTVPYVSVLNKYDEPFGPQEPRDLALEWCHALAKRGPEAAASLIADPFLAEEFRKTEEARGSIAGIVLDYRDSRRKWDYYWCRENYPKAALQRYDPQRNQDYVVEIRRIGGASFWILRLFREGEGSPWRMIAYEWAEISK